MTQRAVTLRAITPREIALKDGFPPEPATFGGFVHRVEDGGRAAVAAAVLVDAGSLEPLSTYVARLPLEAPDDALPALLAALAGLVAPPDITFVEGLGTAGPQRVGLATRFGVATGLPCVGVAVAAPPGMQARINLHDMRGAFTPLRDGAEQVGWLLRSRVGAEPLVVSPAHLVAMPSAPALVLRCIRGDRLPEPLRLALLAL